MSNPTAAELYDVIETTWPSANRTEVGPFIIREGQGGGSRVSAATGPASEADLPLAEEAMRALGQPCQFMIRNGEAELTPCWRAKGIGSKTPLPFTPRQLIGSPRIVRPPSQPLKFGLP